MRAPGDSTDGAPRIVEVVSDERLSLKRAIGPPSLKPGEARGLKETVAKRTPARLEDTPFNPGPRSRAYGLPGPQSASSRSVSATTHGQARLCRAIVLAAIALCCADL